VQGRLDLRGDLWPETDTDDEALEDDGMNEEQVLLFVEAMDRVDIRPNARRDVRTRAAQHFGGRAVDAIEAHDWARQLRTTAPHFFPQQRPASAPAPPSAPCATGQARGQGNPVEPPRPPDALAQAWSTLPPNARLTQYHEWQAAQQPRSSGKEPVCPC
jgi:hypothetical protein